MEDNIKMDRNEIGLKDVDFIHLLKIGTRAESCEHGSETLGSIIARECF
jgi:hypothetical protein